jgi:predicted phage-related endonuclease
VSPDDKGAWLNQRVGKLTASRMADAMDVTKAGKHGAKRIALLKTILAERLTGDAAPNFVSERMLRGLELEPAGKAEFELRTGQMLTDCGFYDHPEIDLFGCTPDSLIGSDGVFEMKAPDTSTHVDYMLAGQVVPERYRPQVLAQLACTGRKTVWFASYDPRIKSYAKQMHIVCWTPEQSEIEAVEQAARDFLAEVDALWEAIHTTQKEAA